MHIFSDCIPLTTNSPCCGNSSMPGKVNPKTNKCEILCNCSGNVTTGVMVNLDRCLIH